MSKRECPEEDTGVLQVSNPKRKSRRLYKKLLLGEKSSIPLLQRKYAERREDNMCKGILNSLREKECPPLSRFSALIAIWKKEEERKEKLYHTAKRKEIIENSETLLNHLGESVETWMKLRPLLMKELMNSVSPESIFLAGFATASLLERTGNYYMLEPRDHALKFMSSGETPVWERQDLCLHIHAEIILPAGSHLIFHPGGLTDTTDKIVRYWTISADSLSTIMCSGCWTDTRFVFPLKDPLLSGTLHLSSSHQMMTPRLGTAAVMMFLPCFGGLPKLIIYRQSIETEIGIQYTKRYTTDFHCNQAGKVMIGSDGH